MDKSETYRKCFAPTDDRTGASTVEFLGIWEQIHNPVSKGDEFETFKAQAGVNSFQWEVKDIPNLCALQEVADTP